MGQFQLEQLFPTLQFSEMILTCNQKHFLKAATHGDLEKVEFLVRSGADIETRDDDGRTPLLNAAANGHLKVVKFLVDHGADTGVRDKVGRTPLSLAAYYEELKVVKFLGEIAADVGNLTKSAARR